MSKDLQIIKELESRFGLFHYELKNNEVTKLKLIFKKVKNEDLELIGELTSLNTLKLDYNDISTIQGLEKLTNLQEFHLKYNNITKIEGLEKLANLQDLDLCNNRITTIQGLDNLANLEYLVLSKNNIPRSQIDQFEAANKKIRVA